MNSFGRLFRLTIFGESHGKNVGLVIDGCPAGLFLKKSDFLFDLKRRKPGGRGTTARLESDTPYIGSGLLNGKTTGAPIILTFLNRDTRPGDYSALRETPRPGHADFVAGKKYGGFNDPRGGGAFSGRLTVSLVSAGVIAKKILAPATVEASILEIGGTNEFKKAIQAVEAERDSLGGLIECRVKGIPVGLGEPFFDSVESMISHLVFSIPGIKGIEFGSGFAGAKMKGSEFNDVILNREGKCSTNHAGGINGGITNGNVLVFRVAVRPTSSIQKEQSTVHLGKNKPVKIVVQGRHDVCIALRMPVIIEAAAAITLVDLMMLEQKIPKIVR